MTTPWHHHPAKRIVDIVASATALVVLSPVMVAVAATVRANMGRPVLYRQERTGLGGKVFPLYKFRTMSSEFDEAGREIPEDQRITRLGRFLRSTSLDELPQLVHILRGEMSLVGPRPLLPEYVDLYSHDQARRLTVRPGLTGLTQVNGRNALAWDHKFHLDLVYVDQATPAMDFRIVVSTIASVLRPRGVVAEGHATSPRFTGSMQDRE